VQKRTRVWHEDGKATWQDLVSDHGFAGGYQAVKRFGEKRSALQNEPFRSQQILLQASAVGLHLRGTVQDLCV
jgi:hypothetical protein